MAEDRGRDIVRACLCVNGGMKMSRVLRGIGIVFKVLFVGVLLVGHFVADLIGLLVCAITSEG